MDERKTKPVMSSRPCGGLEFAVWATRPDNSSVRYTMTIKKSWKDKDGVYQERKLPLTPEQCAAVSLETGRLFAWMAECYPATDETP